MEKAREEHSEEKLSRALDMFRCYQDKDVEDFLRTKAIKFEKDNICRVYLMLDEEQFSKGMISVLAYFTMSPRAVVFSDGVSKNKIKRIAGFKDRQTSEAVLIGQIGKYKTQDENGNTLSADISLDEIMDNVLEVANAIDQYLPCKSLLVECNEELHNKGLYSNCEYPFTYLQHKDGFYQYFRIL